MHQSKVITLMGDFEKEMNELGFVGGLVYGRVTEVIDHNRDFTVKWDIDSQFQSTCH